jgi:hypothetical protein
MVNNVAPTMDARSDQTVDEGAVVNFSGSFTDPGLVDTHTIDWDFGDGTTTGGALPSTTKIQPKPQISHKIAKIENP